MGVNVATIAWEKQNELGVPLLDKQHRALVNLLNGLEVAMSYGDSRSVLGPLLEQFLGYAQEHYEVEHLMLREARCPDVEAHGLTHRAFFNRAQDLHGRFLHEADFMISVEVVRLLRDWLTHHIEIQGCPFSRFLKRGP